MYPTIRGMLHPGAVPRPLNQDAKILATPRVGKESDSAAPGSPAGIIIMGPLSN
jgi:hypothetical protein